jgi:prefoldin subunit 5
MSASVIQELHDRIAELEAEVQQLEWDLSNAEDAIADLECEIQDIQAHD